MATLSIPPKNIIILAAVGIAGYWFFTRQAKAAKKSTPAAANAAFFQSPAAKAGAQQSPAAGNPLATIGLGLINNVLGSLNQPLIRPTGYTPAYTPDNTGEGAALDFYSTHQDNYAANSPQSYITNTDTTGSWLDSQ
jgi:hypothetical protein